MITFDDVDNVDAMDNERSRSSVWYPLPGRRFAVVVVVVEVVGVGLGVWGISLGRLEAATRWASRVPAWVGARLAFGGAADDGVGPEPAAAGHHSGCSLDIVEGATDDDEQVSCPRPRLIFTALAHSEPPLPLLARGRRDGGTAQPPLTPATHSAGKTNAAPRSAASTHLL